MASCFNDPGYCHTHKEQFSPDLRKRIGSGRPGPTFPYMELRDHTYPFYQDIDRGIKVSVSDSATRRAAVDTLMQFQLLAAAAMAAQLRRGIPFVDFDEGFSSVMQLVLQHVLEHAVSVIKSGFPIPEALVGHGAHVQVFHAYDVIPIGYLGCLFMQEVLPLVCRVSVDPGYLTLLLFPVAGTLFLVPQLPLGLGQGRLAFPLVVGHVAGLPV